MIKLSNGHSFEHMVASGGLNFHGRGYLWERTFVVLGFIKPELFTVAIKTLTRYPREGNLRWWKPWDCVRLLPDGGAVNKVGLTNPGIEYWCKKIAPTINFHSPRIMGSIFGTEEELVEMAEMLNQFHLAGLEVNVSCPNTGHAVDATEMVMSGVKAVREKSRHPVIVKVSVAQDFLAIAHGLQETAEAISLNSVPWEIAFPGQRSPLWKLEKKVGGGGGGVSGKSAQKHNWRAVESLAHQNALPVIAPGIMEFEDLAKVRRLGARAVSFGAIHLRTPWKATSIVEKDMDRVRAFERFSCY